MNDNVTTQDKLMFVLLIIWIIAMIVFHEPKKLDGCKVTAWQFGTEVCIDDMPSADPPLRRGLE